jgi:hypothetical protein
VYDSDGEFLLVEAANVLPKWLSPEIDHNRPWLHDGKLFIIPYHQDAPSFPRNLTLTDAVEVIKKKPESLVHSEFIEAEALYRLEKYPGQITDSIHHSLLTIPRKLAFILHSLPKAIAPGVEAFYTRDALFLRSILSATGTLVFPPEDLVTISVRFSKVLFAQLRSQRFEVPPRWQDLMQKAKADGDKAFQRLEMGMKLTCGFEMLASNAVNSKNRTVRELAIILDDLQEDGLDALPSDSEISLWDHGDRDDPENWLDINYEDFERVLGGQPSTGSTNPKGGKGGFGDAQAQENLKKIVSRFEAFLNDDRAGLEGAELDDMDVDDDTDDDLDSNETSDAEDKEVSFDEEEFAKMMREMMGLPSPAPHDVPGLKGREKEIKTEKETTKAAEQLDDSEGDVEEIRQLTSQMEAELKGHGALKLGRSSGNQQSRLSDQTKDQATGDKKRTPDEFDEADEDEDGDDEDVDIDYNLVRNILESFKSQGGMSGPTGNLLGAMGFQLPRDEDDDHGEQRNRQPR